MQNPKKLIANKCITCRVKGKSENVFENIEYNKHREKLLIMMEMTQNPEVSYIIDIFID